MGNRTLKFIDGMLPVLLQLEAEMQKKISEAEVIAAFSNEYMDEILIDSFESVYNIEICKL